MHKRIKTMLLIISIFSTVAISGCSLIPKSNNSREPVLLTSNDISFRSTKVVQTNLQQTDTQEGRIASTNKVIVASSIYGGMLDKINFAQWNYVTKDAIIAEFFSEDVKNEISLQELKVKEKELELKKLKNLKASKDDLNLAQVKLDIEKTLLSQLNEKKNNLIYKSPINGVISELTQASRGAQMSGQDLIAVIQDMDKLALTAKVPEGKLDIYYPGMDAIITYQNKDYNAVVTEVNYRYDPSTRKEQGVVIEFKDNIPENLDLNTTMKYTAQGRKAENVLAVPTPSVMNDGKDNYVFVLKNGIKEKRIVSIGLVAPDFTEILSGLKLDEEIVLN